MAGLERLRELMRRLRDPERGCPWDLEQDFASIAPYTIEEAYEVDDAIRRQDFEELRGELGDLLLQVLFHSQLAEEAGHFDLSDVVESLRRKLVERHPHVFGATEGETPVEHVIGQWEVHKAAERRARGAESALDAIPLGLPALTRAAKLARRARHAGLEPDPEQSISDDLEARLGPLDEAGLGRVIASLARAAARRGLDPETLVRAENTRIETHWRALEARQRATAAQAPARVPEDGPRPALPRSPVDSARSASDE